MGGRRRSFEHQLAAAPDFYSAAAQGGFRHREFGSIDEDLIDGLSNVLPQPRRRYCATGAAGRFVNRIDVHELSPHPFRWSSMCAQAHMNSRRQRSLCHKGGIVALAPGNSGEIVFRPTIFPARSTEKSNASRNIKTV
jgi:hypothetical protein